MFREVFKVKNRKYVVCRDNIYVGEVIKTDEIHPHEEKGKKILISSAYYSLTSILFVLNDKGYAEDLIYNSPNYPVLNLTDDQICLNLESDGIVIQVGNCYFKLIFDLTDHERSTIPVKVLAQQFLSAFGVDI